MRGSLCSVLVLLLSSVSPEPGPDPARDRESLSGVEQELVTRYLLSRLLDSQQTDVDRADQDSASSIVYPQVSQQRVSRPLRKLLDQAKDNIDVIDFRSSRHEDQPEFSSQERRAGVSPERVSPSESVPVFLPFPGTQNTPRQPERSPGSRQERDGKFSMPLVTLDQKKYYIGLFFKANWYKAEQYCRYHGMHLASINSEEEQKNLEEHITSFDEHFWTSGTDQAEEGKFFWMANGKPITYENWNTGEPNNFVYENNEAEHCLELWNRDGKGLRWNDTPCSFETFFVCEL